MMVRFATKCDHQEPGGHPDVHCNRRSPEYTMWPTCSECGDDVCPDHMAPGSLDEGDGDRRDWCLCITCAAEATEP